MADGRLRVTGVPPAGPGLARALARLVKDDSVVTSLDDAKLRALSSMLPEGREVELAPLGDLVGRFLTMLGEPTPRLCPRGQQLATIDLVCRELPGDSPFAESSRFRGTAELVMERLGELRDWDFTAEELRAVAEEAGPRLGAKLVSLAEIDESVREVLEETNRQFSSDRVASCLAIPPEGKLPIRRVVIAAGREERPVYEGWIRWILRFGIDVEVLVDEVPGAERLFAASHRTAKRLGTKVASFEKEEPWYAALFSERVAAGCPRVEILSTPDPLSETEWAMRGCLTEMRAGAMPHRLGVFARDAETYAPLVQASAQRLGVPLSLNLPVPLLTNGFAALTLRCLEALAGNDVRALWRLAGTSYLRGPDEDRSELQEAVGAAFMAGEEQWGSIASWAEGREEGFEWLRHLLAWRDQATESRTTLGGWLHRFIELVGGTRMVDLAMTADAPTRERDKRAQSVLQRSISDYAYIYDRVRRPELGLKSFVGLARSLWENEQMVVEGLPNGVRFVSSTSALTSYDTLFVLGMLEGSLPRRRAEDPILFDTEREELSRLVGRGVRLPDSRDRAVAERDEFVRVCASASRRLVLSYPQTDDSRDNVPAFYLDELERA
ncbi:MAG: hypothetical protein IH945_01595, partial [Armatimonadetes bacterium]|nr:hypothetical protein [Armatimonadota bacterium]